MIAPEGEKTSDVTNAPAEFDAHTTTERSDVDSAGAHAHSSDTTESHESIGEKVLASTPATSKASRNNSDVSTDEIEGPQKKSMTFGSELYDRIFELDKTRYHF